MKLTYFVVILRKTIFSLKILQRVARYSDAFFQPSQCRYDFMFLPPRGGFESGTFGSFTNAHYQIRGIGVLETQTFLFVFGHGLKSFLCLIGESVITWKVKHLWEFVIQQLFCFEKICSLICVDSFYNLDRGTLCRSSFRLHTTDGAGYGLRVKLEDGSKSAWGQTSGKIEEIFRSLGFASSNKTS